jgi:hypothetical protein
MTARVEQALDAYQRLEVETGVAAASAEAMVMLYEGAVKAIYNAKAAVRARTSARAGHPYPGPSRSSTKGCDLRWIWRLAATSLSTSWRFTNIS